ncbi:MAG: hypothetical protein ABSE77_01480 [Acidimicrobiales bacterium]
MTDGPGTNVVVRIELKLTDLASRPSAVELEAITIAVEHALGTVAPGPPRQLSPEMAAWRLGARWWARAPGALGDWRH